MTIRSKTAKNKQPRPSRAISKKPGSKWDNWQKRKDILEYWLKGLSIEEIGLEVGMNATYIERELNKAVTSLTTYYSKPTNSENFVRYAAFQMGLIKQLQDLYDLFMGQAKEQIERTKRADNIKGTSALVGALKAQSDIYDKIYDKGISMGVLQSITEDEDAESALNRKTPEQLRLILKEQATTVITLLEMAEADVQEANFLSKGRLNRIAKESETPKVWREVETNEAGIVYIVDDWKVRKGFRQAKKQDKRLIAMQVEFQQLRQLKATINQPAT